MHVRISATLTLLAALLLSACSSTVSIMEAYVSPDGTRLDFGLDACGGAYGVDVVEGTETVTVTVTDRRSRFTSGRDDCRDHWTLQLTEPLGARHLIDGARNTTIDVHHETWDRSEHPEAEFRAASDAAAGCIRSADPDTSASVADGSNGPVLGAEPGDLPDGATRVDSRSFCTGS